MSKRLLKQPASIVGQSLHEWRKEKNLPLKHVAQDLGVSLSIISGWEKGKRFPSQANFKRISSYTEIPCSCLFCKNCTACRHQGRLCENKTG
ncbi:MAG: XRE family transcriptional regulator [Candidatus Brocadiia bacterium]|nr:MAG: XRE family transcriptional regulator [Candidatus Brocadiia bacterium]